MNQFILALTALKSILVLVRESIAALDDAIPEGGQGQAKLDILRGWVESALAAEARYAPIAQTVWTMLVPLIGAIVAARKAKVA